MADAMPYPVHEYGRCGWNELLLGALPAWATLTVTASAAFLVGCLLTGALARWRHEVAFYGDAGGAVAADGDVASPASEWVGRRRPEAAKTPGTRAAEHAVRASGVTGPLGVGVVVGGIDPQPPSARLAGAPAPLALDFGPARGGRSSAAPSARGPSTQTSPGPSAYGSAAPSLWGGASRLGGTGTATPTGSHRPSDPGSRRPSEPESGRPSAPGSRGPASSSGGPASGRPSRAGSGAPDARSRAHGVRHAYEVEDLDDEWRALVAEADARLEAGGARPCDARERAAVVRALLASAQDEGADAALDRAAAGVLAARRGRGPEAV